jgi:hypothetical protein
LVNILRVVKLNLRSRFTPKRLKQLLSSYHPVAMDNEIHKDLEWLPDQMPRPVAVSKFALLKIQGELTEGA